MNLDIQKYQMIEEEKHIGELFVNIFQVKSFIEQRNQYYENLVSRNPSQRKFLNGWLNIVKIPYLNVVNV